VRHGGGKRLTRHFLLMTATPHNGKEEDFRTSSSCLALLDGDDVEDLEEAPENEVEAAEEELLDQATAAADALAYRLYTPLRAQEARG
jgi:hypothetical protein